MKKLFAFLLVLSLVCCACAALADTDKERFAKQGRVFRQI